jgi:predicted CXXCH cytochrome family protein
VIEEPVATVLALDARRRLAYRLTAMRAGLRNPSCVVGLMAWALSSALARAETPAVAQFAGRAACESCHAAEAKAWQGSHHDLAMQEARQGAVLGNFKDAEFRAGGVVTRFFRKDGRYLVHTDGPDGKLHDYEVKYTFGVHPLQQYLVELPGGRLQALSIAWDTRPKAAGGQRWFHLYPNEKIDYRDELHWTGRNQNWNSMCAECHSTNVRKGYDAETRVYRTTWSELDVSCEACHGPGSRHVAWAKREAGSEALRDKGLEVLLDERKGVGWGKDPQTGNPKRTVERRSEKEIQLCARCHSRRSELSEAYRYGAPLMDTHLPVLLEPPLYHADGQIDGEVYEYGSFVQSRMHRAGVTCSDCHEPHSAKLRAPGNMLCLQCHATERYETPKHHFHPAGSAGASCVACHMPTKTYMVVHARRDHSIRVPRPDESMRFGTPNPCATCHADKPADWSAAKVREWYGRDAAGYQQFAEPLHAARRYAVGAEAKLLALLRTADQPAIARGTAARALGAWPSEPTLAGIEKALADPDPLVRLGGLQAVETWPLERRWQMASPLLDDSVRALRVLAGGDLAGVPVEAISARERAALERALDEYVAVQRFNADHPSAWVNLGDVYAARDDARQAEESYRTALELDPGWIPAYVNFADWLRRADRDADGEKILRAGLERRPNDGSLHHSLGLLLVRKKDMPAAIAELKKAAELAPDDPHFAYVYAVALDGTGKRQEALAATESALRRAPGDRELNELRGELTRPPTGR